MQKGYLSQYFEGVAIKTLRDVDAEPASSNQHEVGTTKEMREAFLGSEKNVFETKFIWLGGEQEGLSHSGSITFYDCRENQPKRSAEWRMYYDTNPITDTMTAGDRLFLAKTRTENELIFIVAVADTTIESQLLWLFGMDPQLSLDFQTVNLNENYDFRLDFAARYILDELGIEYEDPRSNDLEEVVKPYLNGFPSTKEFSQRARLTLPQVSSLDDPDGAIIAWLEHEDAMFRFLEKKFIRKMLLEGFLDSDNEPDVEKFLNYAGSVRQARFSRMGLSLEHHLAAVFDEHNLVFDRHAQTENKSKPDFLFPGQRAYEDNNFNTAKLVMLGSKSTCKDRWRQLLSEAAKVKTKHLFTLEPGISDNQTNEMQAHNIQLVLPKNLHVTYKSNQQDWLLNLTEFVEIVQHTQT